MLVNFRAKIALALNPLEMLEPNQRQMLEFFVLKKVAVVKILHVDDGASRIKSNHKGSMHRKWFVYAHVFVHCGAGDGQITHGGIDNL